MLPTVTRIVDLSHPMYSNMPNIGGQVTFFPLDDHAYLSQITGGRMAMERSHDPHARALRQPSGRAEAQRCRWLECRFRFPGTTGAAGPPCLTCVTGRTARQSPLPISRRRKAGTSRTIGPDAACIVWTGTSKDWGKDDFAMNRPFVPVDAAQWLVDRGIRLLLHRPHRHGRSIRMVVADPRGLEHPGCVHGPATVQSRGPRGEDFLFCLPSACHEGRHRMPRAGGGPGLRTGRPGALRESPRH